MYYKNPEEVRCRSIIIGIVGRTVVRVVYSDESGVGNIKKEPVTVVTAIVLNVDDQWDSVAEALFRILSDTPPELQYRGQLKGSLLYQATRKGISGASTALTQILSIPTRERIGLIYAAVDRQGCLTTLHLPKEESPAREYNIAFAECLKRVDTAARIFAPLERLLWVAHRSDSKREPSTTHHHFMHRVLTGIRVTDEGVRLFPGASGIAPSGVRSSIVDTIYFGNTENSMALQLADVCCSTITLHLLERFYNWSPIVAPFYELIRPQVLIGEERPMYLQ
jgi:hypothetical protein